MSKRIKEMLAADLKVRIGEHREILVVDASALDGVTSNGMRLKLRKQNIRMLGVKNSLAKKALAEIGLEALGQFLAGPTTLVYGGPDIVALSKEIAKWAKDIEKLQIKGGVLDGSPLTPDDVVAISKGPSREELLGKIVMLALSPGAAVAGALLGPGGTVCGQVKSIAEKTEAAAS